MPALETVPPVLPAAPRSILRLLDEEPDRFTTITKIKVGLWVRRMHLCGDVLEL
jgi:hypothetical protein